MKGRNAWDQRGFWLSRPLCRRYVAGFFGMALTPVRHSDGLREHTVHWAFGCLRDGDGELLGVWIESSAGATLPTRVFEELRARGVERIQLVVGADLVGAGGCLEQVFPGATGLQSIEQTPSAAVAGNGRGAVVGAARAGAAARSCGVVGVAPSAVEDGRWGAQQQQIAARPLAQWAPLLALPARLRRVVLSGDRIAEELHASLIRAIGRHGCFASQAAAMDFVVGALLRAERRLDEGRTMAVTAPPSSRVRAAGGRVAPGSF